MTDDGRTQTDYETTFRFPKYYDLVSCGKLLELHRRRLENQAVANLRPVGLCLIQLRQLRCAFLIHREWSPASCLSKQNHLTGLFGGDMKKSVAADVEGSMRNVLEDVWTVSVASIGGHGDSQAITGRDCRNCFTWHGSPLSQITRESPTTFGRTKWRISGSDTSSAGRTTMTSGCRKDLPSMRGPCTYRRQTAAIRRFSTL